MAASDEDMAIMMGVEAYGLAWGIIDHLQERELLTEEQVRDVMKAAHRKLTILVEAQPQIRLFEMAATMMALDLRTRRPLKKSS